MRGFLEYLRAAEDQHGWVVALSLLPAMLLIKPVVRVREREFIYPTF